MARAQASRVDPAAETAADAPQEQPATAETATDSAATASADAAAATAEPATENADPASADGEAALQRVRAAEQELAAARAQAAAQLPGGYVIATERLYVEGGARAHNAGDRVPVGNVERNGWTDKVRPPADGE